MTIVFSGLYSVFGPQPLAFHTFQLLLYIATAILAFLVFRYTFKLGLALALSLIFLLHPINSQNVYAIPTMQEPLFMFFGMLGFWFLLRFGSKKSLIPVAVCLFLSLISKETGIVFIIMSSLYLFWFNRDRLLAFAGAIIPMVAVYLILKINAVGFISHSHLAPIDNLNLGARLLTAPSIILFYITKFIFPVKLASAYYWTVQSVSFAQVLLPLIIDTIVVRAMIYAGKRIKHQLANQFY